MIGRADIEGSKSNVAMNAWLPQASYPCGNFSGTSSLKFRASKGSIGHTFMVCIPTENQNQGDFYPSVPLEISVLDESPFGHLRYLLTDVPPQPNSPPDSVFDPDRCPPINSSQHVPTPASRPIGSDQGALCAKTWDSVIIPAPLRRISKKTMEVVVFQHRPRRSSHLCYARHVFSQCQTRVKLNRVFFPR